LWQRKWQWQAEGEVEAKVEVEAAKGVAGWKQNCKNKREKNLSSQKRSNKGHRHCLGQPNNSCSKGRGSGR